jgi:hypothetical protein
MAQCPDHGEVMRIIGGVETQLENVSRALNGLTDEVRGLREEVRLLATTGSGVAKKAIVEAAEVKKKADALEERVKRLGVMLFVVALLPLFGTETVRVTVAQILVKIAGLV